MLLTLTRYSIKKLLILFLKSHQLLITIKTEFLPELKYVCGFIASKKTYLSETVDKIPLNILIDLNRGNDTHLISLLLVPQVLRGVSTRLISFSPVIRLKILTTLSRISFGFTLILILV